jgi:glutathione S-transferase
MVKYELDYFDGAGRAETTRLMLHLAGVEFEDKRFGFAEWPEIKESTPLGAVPVLKVDGVDYCQSVAMTRYAAKLAGFYPDDPLEALAVDEAMDCMNEVISKFPWMAATEEEKKSKREEFQKTTMKKYADYYEKKIQLAGGSSFASKPNVADAMLMTQVAAVISGMYDYIDKDFYSAYPGITATCKAIKEALMANENVATYMKSREK